MDYFVDMIPCVENPYKMSLLMNMRTIGTKWLDVLAERRDFLEDLKKTPALHDCCMSCIDLIEERT